ncbi:MAG: phosphatidate cytidylyltransferase [Firmicutes bacterium]|nr:phosphatidate cytidylyltransferase [Bacillota bacterium]
MQKKRVLTVLIGAPLLLLAVYWGGWALAAPVMLLAALAVMEMLQVLPRCQCRARWLLGLAAAVYICAGFIAFALLRLDYPDWRYSLFLLCTVWFTDTGAYEIGRRFGKRRMAPSISPQKTWEGAVAGLLLAVAVAGVYGAMVLGIDISESILLAALVSVFAQAGDLLESKYKRMSKVKDSGCIFPGHGGVLDRFDSILLASMTLYVLLRFSVGLS